MAGTTIKGVGNGSNVQMPDLTTAAKQNEGIQHFQAYGIRPRAVPRQQTRARITVTVQITVMSEEGIP